ncbi:MAG: hypothetical protein V7K77_04010 [Nostoc sp.]
MSTTVTERSRSAGYAYAILSFSLLKIDGGAIRNAFPGGTWERVLNF